MKKGVGRNESNSKIIECAMSPTQEAHGSDSNLAAVKEIHVRMQVAMSIAKFAYTNKDL